MNRQLEDKEMLNVILNQHKLYAGAINTLILESANQNIRNDATSVLQNVFKHQKQIFDVMSQKGWYSTDTASTDEITRAREEVGVSYSY